MTRELIRAIGQAINLEANWPLNIERMTSEECFRHAKRVRLERDRLTSATSHRLILAICGLIVFGALLWSLFDHQSPWLSLGLILGLGFLSAMDSHDDAKREQAAQLWERTALVWDTLAEFKSIEEQELYEVEQTRIEAHDHERWNTDQH